MEDKIVEAEILCMSADILMGKATKESIKRTTDLAIANNMAGLLKKELDECTRRLTNGS